MFLLIERYVKMRIKKICVFCYRILYRLRPNNASLLLNPSSTPQNFNHHTNLKTMKPILVRLLAFLSPLALNEAAIAQNSSSPLNFTPSTVKLAVAPYVAAEADLRSLTEMKALSPKMFERFTRDFKSAYDIRVYPNKTNKTIQVNSKTDGDMNRTTYTAKGKFLNNIKHYDFTKLPESIANNVNDAYPRYEIFGGVAEITVINKVAYFVLIENKKSWKRLKIVNDEIEVYEEFVKSADEASHD